jgi:hypothetical protein
MLRVSPGGSLGLAEFIAEIAEGRRRPFRRFRFGDRIAPSGDCLSSFRRQQTSMGQADGVKAAQAPLAAPALDEVNEAPALRTTLSDDEVEATPIGIHARSCNRRNEPGAKLLESPSHGSLP